MVFPRLVASRAWRSAEYPPSHRPIQVADATGQTFAAAPLVIAFKDWILSFAPWFEGCPLAFAADRAVDRHALESGGNRPVYPAMVDGIFVH
jgi:hypothetical protein